MIGFLPETLHHTSKAVANELTMTSSDSPRSSQETTHCLILGGGYAGIQAFKNTIRLLRLRAGCQCRPGSSRPAAFDCAASTIELLTDYLPPLLAHAARNALPAPDFVASEASSSSSSPVTDSHHSRRRGSSSHSNASRSSSQSTSARGSHNPNRQRVVVSLITGSTHYFHMIATPRAIAAGHDPDKLLFPYENLVPPPCTCNKAAFAVDGELRVATITRVGTNAVQVQIDGGVSETVPLDFGVVALGSGYPFPWKVPFDWPFAKVRDAVARYQQVVRDEATHIVVVGSGVVGVEVAAELASEHPSKRIAMFGPASHGPWGSKYDAHVSQSIKRKRIHHVATLPGTRVNMHQSFGQPPSNVAAPWLIHGPVAVKDTDGSTLALIGSGDDARVLVIDCTGTRSQLVPFDFGGEEASARSLATVIGQKDIAVDQYLRIENTQGRIFAAGDMCRPPVPAGKLAYVAAVQGNIAAANLAETVHAHFARLPNVAETKLTKFNVLPDLAVVTLGRHDGVAVLPYIGVPSLGTARIGAIAFKGDGGYRTARPLIGKSQYDRHN